MEHVALILAATRAATTPLTWLENEEIECAGQNTTESLEMALYEDWFVAA